MDIAVPGEEFFSEPKPSAETCDVHQCACGHSETPHGGEVNRPHALAELTTLISIIHYSLDKMRSIATTVNDDEVDKIVASFEFGLLAPARKLREHLGLGYPFETVTQIDAFVQHQENYPPPFEEFGASLLMSKDSPLDPTLNAIHSIIDAADHWITDKTDIDRAAWCMFRVFVAAIRAGYKPSELLNRMRVIRTKGKTI